jgi:hypothetical protein
MIKKAFQRKGAKTLRNEIYSLKYSFRHECVGMKIIRSLPSNTLYPLRLCVEIS